MCYLILINSHASIDGIVFANSFHKFCETILNRYLLCRRKSNIYNYGALWDCELYGGIQVPISCQNLTQVLTPDVLDQSPLG